jgi:hypothetical protein
MRAAIFDNPRPEPGHLLPALGSGLVLVLALPVFLVAGLPVGGWALAAVIWIAVHLIDALLLRTRRDTATLAAGVQAFGLFFKLVGLLVVLVAALAASPRIAVAAAVTYALAYTFELGLSLVGYFGAAAK